MKNYTITHFKKDYSTNDACLDKIFELKYNNLKSCPKCKQLPLVELKPALATIVRNATTKYTH